MTEPVKDLIAALDVAINALATPVASAKREFGPPDLPPGVARKNHTRYMALDSAPMLAQYQWLNSAALTCGMGFPGYQYLSELTQRTEYRAPAETIATEATRRWFELVSDGENDSANKIKELTQDINDFGLREICRRLIEGDSYFGRMQLAINIKGQELHTANPLLLDPKTVPVGSLQGFRTVEPLWTTPLMWNSLNPAAPDFYKPTSWFVMGTEWHSTRLLTFVARELPDMLKPAYNFSGMSMSQLIEPYVQRWLRTVDSVSTLINNFAKLVLKTNMSQLLQGDVKDATSLLKRIQLYTQAANNRGVLALDKDSEEFQVFTVSLANLHELQAQSQEHMAMPTHIPLVKLTGISPSGLNASSEGEIKVWYDWVNASTQESFLGQHMPTIIGLLQLNRYGAIDPSIKVRWIPLDQPTDAELAAMRKSDADAGSVYVTNGVISPDEERARLQGDPNSGYDTLTGAAPEHPDDLDHERNEEAAQNAHERDQEAAENEAKRGAKASTKEHERGEKSAVKEHARAKELKRMEVVAKKKAAK